MAGINFVNEQEYSRKLVAKKPIVYTQLVDDSGQLCEECENTIDALYDPCCSKECFDKLYN